jgi:hypothetical protein
LALTLQQFPPRIRDAALALMPKTLASATADRLTGEFRAVMFLSPCSLCFGDHSVD